MKCSVLSEEPVAASSERLSEVFQVEIDGG